MGWRGTLRSINAAGRSAQRASERKARAVTKLHSRADSTLTGLDAEIEREIQRIANYEDKVCSHPAKTLGLWFEAAKGWGSVPFKEQTGKVTYEINYKPGSLDAEFAPPSIDLGGVTITPRSVSVCQHFTAIAFDASTGPSEGGRILKLTFPSKPETSRIALSNPSGEIFNPLDTTLDGRVFAGATRTGVVAFEPFSQGHEHFEILLEAPPKARGAAGETLRIRVSWPSLANDMALCLDQPGILEQMAERLRTAQKTKHEEIGTAVKEATTRASSGCLVMVALSAFTILAASAGRLLFY